MVAHGTPCLGPVTHAGCGALCPSYDRGCYGCFGPMEIPEHAVARRLARAASASTSVDLVRVYRTFHAAARAVPRARAEAHEPETARPGRSRRTRWPASRARARCTSHPRRRGRGRRAAHLRAAALLRGVPARPPLHRGARHHRAHLRHLPGRLPDERLQRRWRTRCGVARRRADPRAAAAHLLRRVDREPRAARVPAARARLPRLRERVRDGARPPRGRRERARAQEGGQRADAGSSAAGRSTRSTSASAASTGRRVERELDARWSSRSRRRASSRVESVRWVVGARLPRLRARTTSSSRCATPDRYAIERGRLVSSGGLDLAPGEYDEHFAEEHVAHSTALHSRLRERRHVPRSGRSRATRSTPTQLSPLAREAAEEAGPRAPSCRNPFQSIVVRAVEILYAFDEALRLIEAYEPPDRAGRRGRAAGRASATAGREAPRGLLWHRYRLDEDGTILDARIVPPTSQNQARIEQDLLRVRRPRRRPPRRRAAAAAASRRSATTTRASPAPPTS